MDDAVKSYENSEKIPQVLKMYLTETISEDGVYDGVHSNAKGSRQIANYIYKNIFKEQ